MNNIKTVTLLGALTGLFLLIGGMAGGQAGMLIALVFAALLNLAAYWFSDSIVLKTYRAKPLERGDAEEIYAMVAELARSASIPAPRLFVIDSDSPNAFATGRTPEKGVIVLSRGIMRVMNRHELRGVIAHELSHIKNRDTLIQSVAATVAGAIMFLAYQMRWFAFFGGGDDDDGGVVGLLVMALLAPLAATIIQLAISRSREYGADESAAEIGHDPEGLASALEKLGEYKKKVPMQRASQHTAHLFIVSPLKGGGLLAIFSTHPPLEKRIARLRGMRTVG